MASAVNAFLCALLASAFWMLVGYAICRRLLPRPLATGAAGVTGWAVHSAVALPVFIWIGLTPTTVLVTGSLCVLSAGVSLWLPKGDVPAGSQPQPTALLVLAYIAAALLAFIPAVAVLPKFHGEVVQLSDPIFDHAKSAFVDTIARLGVPAVNPIFASVGGPQRLAYYYLWHFSAAELTLGLGAKGWEADAGLTWFTAFTSLMLMMELAVWLAKRATAAIWVVALAAAGSLWITLYAVFHRDNFLPVIWESVGMDGWLFQASWVPQHMMAAGCVMVAMLLLSRVARDQSPVVILTLALVVVAGFESSSYVGGVTFALAAMLAAPFVYMAAAPRRRLRLTGALVLAAVLVICLIAPFVLDQLAVVRARNLGGSPIIVSPYQVFGEALPLAARRLLDLPAFWLLLLPVELPACFVAGIIGLVVLFRGKLPRTEKLILQLLVCLAAAGLAVSWLLFSTVGDNNDLGLRAIIPVIMVLIVGAATAAANVPTTRLHVAAAVAAAIGLALSLPDAARMARDNFAGQPRPDGLEFAQSPELWAAVRRHAAPDARIANNPLFVGEVTPWPVNISWALLADRSSCFAGHDMAAAFAPVPAQARAALDAQFARVFEGGGTADDIHELATAYGCDVAVVVRSDKAWERDPFAASADYRLAETRDDRWRIYVRTGR